MSTQIETADVYKAGRLAGQLCRDRDDVVFAYAERYLADPGKPPVAFTLPKTARPYRSTGGSVPAFFAGLLPEGLRLHAISTAVKTSEDDHLSILLAVGADTIGDVQVVPAGSPPVDPPPLADDTDTSNADFAALFARATSPDLNNLDKTALAGAQVKVSARMISTPIASAHGPAILKLAPPEHPHLLENENFFLDMASACGIRVPHHHLATDRAGRTALFVTRFDRMVKPGSVKRLAQEDACQVLDRYPAASIDSRCSRPLLDSPMPWRPVAVHDPIPSCNSWKSQSSATSSAMATSTAKTCPFDKTPTETGRPHRPTTF